MPNEPSTATGDDSREDRQGMVLTLTFQRPAVHNALTGEMYDAVRSACAHVAADKSVRCLVLRGTSGGTFASGTDINYFRSVRSGVQGVAYEAGIRAVLEDLVRLPVPTVAVIEGYAIGGGLLLAAACDLRVCTTQARFGIPIARTLGNCVSQYSYDLLAARLGSARALNLLLTAELLDAAEAATAGFVVAAVDPEAIEERVDRLVASLCDNAPLSMRAAKSADRAYRSGVPATDDEVRICYGSADFSEGVAAFLAGRKPVWQGS